MFLITVGGGFVRGRLVTTALIGYLPMSKMASHAASWRRQKRVFNVRWISSPIITCSDDCIICEMESMKACTLSGMSGFRHPIRVSNSTEPMAVDKTTGDVIAGTVAAYTSLRELRTRRGWEGQGRMSNRQTYVLTNYIILTADSDSVHQLYVGFYY